MSLRTHVGLADLAKVCAKLRPRQTELESIASLLGLVIVDSFQLAHPVDPGGLSFSELSSDGSDHNTTVTVIDEEEEDSPLDYPLSSVRRELQASRVWGSHAVVQGFPKKRPLRAIPSEIPLGTAIPEIIARANAWPCPSEESVQSESPKPLIRVPLRRAFLRDAVAVCGDFGDVDTARLTAIVARGQRLRSVPRLKRRRVKHPTALLIDISQPMATFLDEANDLAAVAQDTLGCSLARVTWSVGPPDPARIDDTRPWPILEPGTTLLVFSLLGLCGSERTRDEWTAFAKMATRRRVRLVAVTPALKAHWASSAERTYWHFVQWMPMGYHYALCRQDQTQMLATILSVIANPSPAIVREARHRYFTNTEPFLESSLIESRWVAAAFQSRLVMRSDELGVQHKTLAGSPALLLQVRELGLTASKAQAPKPPLDVLAEKLWLDALQPNRVATKSVDTALAGLIKSLQENPDSQALARFANTVLTRLPIEILETELGRIARLLVRCGLRQQLDDADFTLAVRHQSWLYPQSTIIGIAWNGRKLFIRDRPRSGDVLITIPDTPRRHLRVDWGPYIGSEWRFFFRGHRDVVVAPELPAAVTTLRGQKFTLSQPDEGDLWHKLQRSLNHGDRLRGKVISAVMSGDRLDGYLVDVGITAFLTSFEVTSTGFVDAPESWIGQSIDIVVTKIDSNARHVEVSRALALSELTFEEAKTVLATFRPGQEVDGRVLEVGRKGISVRVRSITGRMMRSASDLDATNPLLQPGDDIVCSVVSVELTYQRLELRLKRVSDQRWRRFADRFPEGSVAIGRVINFSEQGAFVELAPGFAGYLSRPEMTWSKLAKKPSDLLSLGQEIEVLVLKVLFPRQRVTLSRKRLLRNPWLTVKERFPVGSKVRGIVVNIRDFGVFVELADGIVGLIHESEMSWHNTPEPPRVLVVEGQSIDVVITKVEPDKERIHLSIKALQPNPWKTVSDRYPIGTVVKGIVRKIMPYGAFIEIEVGIEGLLHVSAMGAANKKDVQGALAIGEEVEVVVLSVDVVKQHISLGST